MADLNFTTTDIETALDAIATAVNFLAGKNPSLIERFEGLARRFLSNQLYFSRGELFNICIALELLLKEQPLNWNASRLLSSISSVCNYTKQDF